MLSQVESPFLQVKSVEFPLVMIGSPLFVVSCQIADSILDFLPSICILSQCLNCESVELMFHYKIKLGDG